MTTDQQLAALVRSSQDAMISQTSDGVIASWNPAAEALYGYSEDEAVGRPLEIIIPPERLPEHRDTLARTLSGQPVAHYESRHRAKDGSDREVSVTISALCDDGAELRGASIVARDVSERRAIERALAEAHRTLEQRTAALQASNADLEQFAYVTSHDLSEPLRAVSGFAELLSRRYAGQLDETADRYIRHTVDGCRRMQGLIEDLLAYSRVGRRQPAVEAVEAESLLDDAVEALCQPIAEAGATIERGPLPVVVGDRRLLSQLFQNLLSNAIKFRAAQPPTIVVSAHGEAGEWVFSVRDDGIGIDPGYAERIFNVFNRLHTRSAFPGSGIGLAICKRVVECHGGRIWVEPADPGGSDFRFTLPETGPPDG